MIKKKDLDQGNIKAWEEYIKNPSDIYDKDKNYSKENDRNGRFKYDLHGYTLDDANRKVREIILSCKEKNYKEILLITGKGLHSQNDKDIYVSKNLGTLRYSVPEFIKSEFTFIGVKESSVEKYEKIKDNLFATVKFVAEVISVKRDKENKIIEGNPDKIKFVTDNWKFTKNIKQKSPNWYLSEIIK